MNVVGLVPCAGLGTRLGLPFSKEMFPDLHAGSYRPVIAHALEVLKLTGVTETIFTISPNKTDLLTFLGNGKRFGMRFTYCIHPEPISLAHSLDEAYHVTKDRTVAFVMPDTIITPTTLLQDTLALYLRSEAEVTLTCFKTNTPQKFGMVRLLGDKVTDIQDKPSTTDLKWMWGAMIWGPQFTDSLHRFVSSGRTPETEPPLSNSLADAIGRNKVNALLADSGRYVDIGTYDEIWRWATAVERN